MYFETQKLSVGYHRRPLIEDIDIGIWQGGILCLIGPNGSGKSTILRSITRHLTKLGGVVAIGGRDLDGMSDKELARHVSVVLTDRIEPELMTCWEVVAAGRYPYTNHFGKLSREDQRIVEDSMARVNALELREQRFTELSDGQKQRVLLARALCQQPEVIVLDEPPQDRAAGHPPGDDRQPGAVRGALPPRGGSGHQAGRRGGAGKG